MGLKLTLIYQLKANLTQWKLSMLNLTALTPLMPVNET